MPASALPKLPKPLDRKIYKTGQTRGADDDEIHQNRVLRSSTVLIRYRSWQQCAKPAEAEEYKNGFIVLLSPEEYFGEADITGKLVFKELEIGRNALVFYEDRRDWTKYPPSARRWRAAERRRSPLGGEFVARIPATTASAEGSKIIQGFHLTKPKGAGIRVYEYASTVRMERCRWQLEALFWRCADAKAVVMANGMSAADASRRERLNEERCRQANLLDSTQLEHARILNARGVTICPLCLAELSGGEFFSRVQQAEGREVSDLTITQVNLFHIAELRVGTLGHRPYNLGWGHHHYNVVVKDAGIAPTLRWMSEVVERNRQAGLLPDVE